MDSTTIWKQHSICTNQCQYQHHQRTKEIITTDYRLLSLIYGRAIDNTILPSLRKISTSLNTSTWEELSSRIKWLLDYIATHPETKIEYRANDMHLWIHTDASTNQTYLLTPMIAHHS